MKRLALCLFVAAACGGGGKSSTSSTMPESKDVARPAAPDCKAAATHMAAGNADVASGLEQRCEQHQWSDEARACLAEKPEDTCPLTDEQKAGVADARAKAGLEEGKMGKKEVVQPASAPPPPAEDAPKTRGAVKKKQPGDGKTADPCEGGE